MTEAEACTPPGMQVSQGRSDLGLLAAPFSPTHCESAHSSSLAKCRPQPCV